MPRKNHRQKPTKHSHFKLKEVENCQNKTAYPNRMLAENAARMTELNQFDLELTVYHCPICGHWHLSRKKPELDHY